MAGLTPSHLNPVSYFQWLEFILMICALLLALPNMLYNQLQSRSFKNVIVDDQEELLENMEKYFQPSSMNHTGRVLTFFFFEFLNLVAVALMMIIASVIMNRNFITFGLDVLFDVVSPFKDSIFPKTIDCNIKIVSPNGRKSDNGVVCQVNINYINEVIFCIVYIWMIYLLVAGVVNVFYQILQMTPCYQKWSMKNTTESAAEKRKLERIASELPWATRLVWVHVGSILPTKTYSKLIVYIYDLVPEEKKDDDE